MAARTCFSQKRPQIPHLVQRKKGGVSGEVADLRVDVDQAFGCIEQYLDGYIEVADEELSVAAGAMLLNFSGAGVAVTADPLVPGRVNVLVPGGSTGAGNVQERVQCSLYPEKVPIGWIDAGRTVEKVSLEVVEAADTPVQVTVGDDVGEGRFLTVHDSVLDRAGRTFVAESGHRYTSTTLVHLYFAPALIPPTAGVVRVIVYFS